MIGNNYFKNIPTDLELNGPILEYALQPSDATLSVSGIATFSGIATASFPSQTPTNPALNSGTISYRWYEVGVGELSDSSRIAGSATTTLTITDLQSPDDNNRQFYLTADYVPALKTPNAVNEVLNSNTVTLRTLPFITIQQQPQSVEIGSSSDATFSVIATISDSFYGELSYQWQLDGVSISDGNGVSGSSTPTLTISKNVIDNYKVRVVISNASATSVTSNEVDFDVVEPRSIVVVESYDNTSLASIQSYDLTFDNFEISYPTNRSDTICMYASENDIDVELDMYGAKGENTASYNGGQGGYSKIRFTMNKNEEYILRGIGSNSSLYLYRKANLIACVGKGGDAGTRGRGGNGGGVNSAGENGEGRDAGNGGRLIAEGQLSPNGSFGSSANPSLVYPEDTLRADNTGGTTISCSKGVYWRNQGKSSCEDVGRGRFRQSDGTVITNSGNIDRGFKSGYSINQTSGLNGGNNSGNGGNGTVGGNGGLNGFGGGGGSGYSNGSVGVIETQQGGNPGNARIFMRIFNNFPAQFFSSNIINAYTNAGTVGSRIGFTNGNATGRLNGFRYDAPPANQNYFSELRITNSSWSNSHGFVGVCDDTHWSVLDWTSASGVRMMYYLGNNFSYGEASGPFANSTGSVQTSVINANGVDSYTTGTFSVDDILGMVVNQQRGTINYYKNGNYICTIRNSSGAGRRLYVAVSDWFFRQSLACESLTSPSRFASRYLLAD